MAAAELSIALPVNSAPKILHAPTEIAEQFRNPPPTEEEHDYQHDNQDLEQSGFHLILLRKGGP